LELSGRDGAGQDNICSAGREGGLTPPWNFPAATVRAKTTFAPQGAKAA